MIELSDEMADAYDEAAWADPVELGGLEMANVRAGLAAVLAIVERNYRLTCPASFVSAETGGVVRCTKDLDGHTTHMGVHPSAAVIW